MDARDEYPSYEAYLSYKKSQTPASKKRRKKEEIDSFWLCAGFFLLIGLIILFRNDIPTIVIPDILVGIANNISAFILGFVVCYILGMM